MRAARRLVQERELWQATWQQVETFLDRIKTARDQDGDDRRRFEALMTIAGVVERERATRVDDKPLGDPVVDAPPLPSLGDGWGSAVRRWRIPGTDELELAVANLYEEPGSGDDRVVLLPPRTFFSYPVEPNDPAFEEADEGRITVRAPSYPGVGETTIAGPSKEAGAGTIVLDALTPELKEDSATPWAQLLSFLPGIPDEGTLVSLFPPNNRGHAARDVDQTGTWVLAWSALTANRRAERQSQSDSEAEYHTIATTGGTAWAPGLANEALVLASAAIANLPYSGGSGLAKASEIASAANAAAALVEADATRLQGAADILDDVGVSDQDLANAIEQAVAAFAQRPVRFRAVASAASALAGLLAIPLGLPAPASTLAARATLAATLAAEVSALAATLSANPGPLFASVVEAGPIKATADAAAAARIAYPDGSLRILRALEEAFVRFWPGRIRALRERHALALVPQTVVFRSPFVTGLGALLSGGHTGLPVEGLTLLAPATTRAGSLSLDLPASVASALRGIETGHVGLFLGERESAAVILGLAPREGRLALNIAPLRVSSLPAAGAIESDTPGIIRAGRTLQTVMPGTGLSNAALRAGEHPSEPARDGIVEQAVILYGELALLFGRDALDDSLAGATGLPAPSDVPLHNQSLHGSVPAAAATLVLRGLPDAFWDRSDPADPLPRVARPGEILLLRGRGETVEGLVPRIGQAAIQVESVYRTTVKAFNRMDSTTAALLSTSPLGGATVSECLADCEPEEDLAVLTLAKSYQRGAIVADITLRRDFAGFDLPSLACGRLLPTAVVEAITGAPPPGAPALDDVDRSGEFAAATAILDDWLRMARQ